jgi:hypothetical protein
MIPTAVPVDESGVPDIPELHGRTPTHNEAFAISGQPLSTFSTNVEEFWWNWREKRLFVRFLGGTFGYYDNVPLSLVVKFIETSSHGRFVHKYLAYNPQFPWTAIERPTPGTARKKPQVGRLVDKRWP